VDVGGDGAIAGHFHALMTRDFDVLADLRDGGDAVGFEVGGRVCGELLRDLFAERAEGFVAGHEVCFAVHFDEQAELSAGLDVLNDHAFLRIAISFLAGGRDALLAEDVHGDVENTIGFDERFFAIHQAGTGRFAELADI